MSKAIGEKIKKLREAKGYTQTDIGQLLGIAQNTLACKEAGQVAFKVEELAALSKFFEVSLDDLVSDKELIINTSINIKFA